MRNQSEDTSCQLKFNFIKWQKLFYLQNTKYERNNLNFQYIWTNAYAKVQNRTKDIAWLDIPWINKLWTGMIVYFLLSNCIFTKIEKVMINDKTTYKNNPLKLVNPNTPEMTPLTMYIIVKKESIFLILNPSISPDTLSSRISLGFDISTRSNYFTAKEKRQLMFYDANISSFLLSFQVFCPRCINYTHFY